MNNIFEKVRLCSLLLLLSLPGCFIPSRYYMRKNIYIAPSRTQLCNFEQKPNHAITVWLHGTRLFSRPLYNRHFKCQPGLTLATSIDKDHKLHKIAQTLAKADPHRFTLDQFYIFGWSGKLCFLEREYAADKLYASLHQLVHKYREKHNVKPTLRLFAHSHGGNVVLNLAQLVQTKNDLTIDELILMACPVQGKTKHHLKNPMFKQIYVLYSALDFIQILDPQGAYKDRGTRCCGFFSKRQFLHQPNLAQMKVKLNRRAIMHSEFSSPPFLQHLPRILDEIDAWHQQIVYKEDPNKICKLLCVYTDRKAPKNT